MKKKAASFTALVIALSWAVSLTSCGEVSQNESVRQQANGNISAAVISTLQGENETYAQLRNGAIANIDVDRITNDRQLNGYDIVYLDKSLLQSDDFNVDEVVAFVQNGGSVVLDNQLVNLFPKEFLGASDVVHIDECPVNLEYSEVSDNLLKISQLINDYCSAFKEYTNFEDYENYDYGYGIIPSTAMAIASCNGVGVYTVNNYGKGYVFLTNPMLPSDYTVSYLTEFDEGKQPLAFSTTAAGNLLNSYYAEFVSLEKYGFAVERSFGSFGTRNAAWELHYEDITAIRNNSLETFSRMCMRQGQMPSYTIARNLFTWFKRAESITYLKGDGERFINDRYEGVYCSGTHVVSGGKWLELDNYEKTESYFKDNPEYIKRAYPFPYDLNGDGKIDFICGSADGNIYYFEGNGMKTNYETGIATLLTDSSGNALNVGSYSSPVLFDIDGDGLDEIISGSEDGTIYSYHTLKNENNPSSLAYEATGIVLESGMQDSMISAGDLNGDNITDLAVGSRNGELRIYYGHTEDGHNTYFRDYMSIDSNQSWIAPCIYKGELYGGTCEGYVAKYKFNGETYELDDYLKMDDVSRRGNDRVTIGMNCVPRFADIDGDGTDDLICGSLEYGMAYPIDSEYFPYKDELKKQFNFCKEYNIYMGVHGFTHQYATPEHEKQELEYHHAAFDKLGLPWDKLGINQHTWYTSKYGYDGSNADGFNPNYDGTFKSQYAQGLLWNSGSMLPESSAVPQSSAEDAIPMPVYMPNTDFLLLQTSNTPHGKGEYSYMSVKYDMPMLFYNHCDYIYEESNEQIAAIDKVGKLMRDYDYVFVGEAQMAFAVAAAYNSDIKTVIDDDGTVRISAVVRDKTRGLYNADYAECVGVKVVFANGDSAENYMAEASVCNKENGNMYVSLDKTAVIKKGLDDKKIAIEQINIPADVDDTGSDVTVKFKDDGLMYVRVKGDVSTSSPDWTVYKENGDTIFMKFGKAQSLKIGI